MRVSAEDRQAVTALQALGFTRPAAAKMIARGVAYRLRKSIDTNDNPLPVIDTSAADQRREDRERKESASNQVEAKGKKKSFLDRIKNPNVKSRKYVTEKVKRLTGAMVTRYKDGSLFIRPQNAPPKNYDPGFTLDQQADMLKMVSEQFQEQSEKVNCRQSKETVKEDQKEMKKSKTAQRFERLVSIARTAPEKLTAGTRQAVSAYLQKQGKPAITVPVPAQPWFRQPTLGEVAARREAIAANVPASAQPFIPISEHRRMTTAEITQHKLEQARQLEAARIDKPAIEDASGTASFIHF